MYHRSLPGLSSCSIAAFEFESGLQPYLRLAQPLLLLQHAVCFDNLCIHCSRSFGLLQCSVFTHLPFGLLLLQPCSAAPTSITGTVVADCSRTVRPYNSGLRWQGSEAEVCQQILTVSPLAAVATASAVSEVPCSPTAAAHALCAHLSPKT